MRVVVRQGFNCSKLLLPSSRPGGKTNFVVAELYVHFYAAVVLGCEDDRITNITQKQYHEFMAAANVCYHMRIPVANENTSNMVAFVIKIPRILSPVINEGNSEEIAYDFASSTSRTQILCTQYLTDHRGKSLRA